MTSTIKVNNIQNQCGANIINESSNTITIGASGDTIALASGASQTGFGRTGTVDWQTGSIKTATFTATNGEGYFCNTTSGGFTVNLPAGSAGAIVSVQDYNNTFDSNSLTVAPNGSEKINGGSAGGPIILNTEGEGLTLVYIDSTVGWRSIQDSSFADTGNNFINATGGTITTSGNCKIHTFTGPGTFTVVGAAVCAANNVVSHLVVAGGGAGQGDMGGGGGAGGFREVESPVTPYTASPLDGYPSAPNRVTVTAQAYPITVGAGGSGPPSSATPSCANGSNSIFSTVTSAGGGGGTQAGGSGGGGRYAAPAGAGNTPPVSPAQGNNGGSSSPPGSSGGGGGGGAGAVGSNHSSDTGGAGGAGVTTEITASPVTRAGGGGGGGGPGATPGGAGGSGGGGAGGKGGDSPGPDPGDAGSAGTVNTGGGGGAGGGGSGAPAGAGGNGGSGIVVIRYKFQ